MINNGNEKYIALLLKGASTEKYSVEKVSAWTSLVIIYITNYSSHHRINKYDVFLKGGILWQLLKYRA